MTDGFKKLMRDQVQEVLNSFTGLAQRSIPRVGWIRTIREALGISSYVLADRLQCTRSNISSIEERERKGTITLETLREVARGLDCQVVYCLVPNKPLDQLLENQARKVAHKRVARINHSMKLEKQGLSKEQLRRQEDDLVEELLRGDIKKLWVDK